MTTEGGKTAFIRRQGKESALIIRRAFTEALCDTVGLSDKLLVSRRRVVASNFDGSETLSVEGRA
jgi:hypothetical protein